MSVIGQVPILPAATAPIPLGAVSVSSLGALTLSQQESIVRGTIVITPTQSLVYNGYGSKTDPANYTELLSPGYATDSEVASGIQAYNAGTLLRYQISNPAQTTISIPGGNMKMRVDVVIDPYSPPIGGIPSGSTIEVRLPRGIDNMPGYWTRPPGTEDQGARPGHTVEIVISGYTPFVYNYIISSNPIGPGYFPAYTPIVSENTQGTRGQLRAKLVFQATDLTFGTWTLEHLAWGQITPVETMSQEYINFSGAGGSPPTRLEIPTSTLSPSPTHRRIMVNVLGWTAPTPALELILPDPKLGQVGDRLILERTGQQPSSGPGSVQIYIKQKYHVSGSFNSDGDWSGERYFNVYNDASPGNAIALTLPQGEDAPSATCRTCLEFVLVGDPRLGPPPTGAGVDMRKREWVLVGHPTGIFTEVQNAIQSHKDDTTDVHGIYNTAYLTYKEEASGLFHRNLFGWPANKLSSPRGTEQSFLSYGSSPVLFDGTEGWGAFDRPIYYVPIFIKNTAQVQFTIRVPVKNYSGSISAALFAGDNFNGNVVPSSNGHMTLVLNMGSLSVAPEDTSCVFNPGSTSVRRGWHFVALYFSADPTGKIYRSVYSPNGPTYGEYVFESQRRTFIEDTTEKQRRIGSVIRRVNGAPSWPPVTTSAPNLFNYVENPVTPKLLYQWNGPDGSVAVNNPMNPRASFFDPSHDLLLGQNIIRVNDGNYPPTPEVLSVSAPSPQGGYNLLASAVPGALNLNTSTRFQQDMQTVGQRVTEIRFYTRSTSTGPTNIRTRLWSGTPSATTLYSDIDSSVSTASTWQQIVLNPVNTPLGAATSLHIYGYGGSAAASAGNWRLDNIEMRGTFSSPISPFDWTGMDPSIHLFAFSEVVPLFYWGYNTVVSGDTI